MSKIAGVILVILGGFFLYLGGNEIRHLEDFTIRAAYCITAAGGILFLVGLLHFKAPHKAFLISIPVLVFLQLLVFLINRFYVPNSRWLYYQVMLAMLSLLTLWVSYTGYRNQKKQVTAS